MPLSCPNCDTLLSATRDQAGQIVRCPACQTKLRLPMPKSKPQPVVTPQPVQPLPEEQLQQVDPLSVPLVTHTDPLQQPFQASLAPVPRQTQPSQSTYRSGFQKQRVSSGPSNVLIYSMCSLGILGILAAAGVVAYTVLKSPDVEVAAANEPDETGVAEVVQKEIVLPNGAGSSTRSSNNNSVARNGNSSSNSGQSATSTGAATGSNGSGLPGRIPGSAPERTQNPIVTVKQRNTVYFDGISGDEAPTHAKTSGPKDQYVYSEEAWTNRKTHETWKRFYKLGIDHLAARKEIPDAYRERAVRWAEDVIDVDLIFYPSSEKAAKRFEAIHHEGERLFAVPEILEDPFLNYLRARLIYTDGDSDGALEFAEKAIFRYMESDYPARFPVLAHSTYISLLKSSSKQRVKTRGVEKFVDTVLYWFENDFRAEADEHRIVYSQMESVIIAARREELALVEEMLTRLEDGNAIPEWVRLMTKARMFGIKAWNARGGGVSSTVSDQGWREFKKLHKLAGGYYRQAMKLSPNFPEAATDMIDIARAGNCPESYEYWFEQAVKVQFDYLPAYDGMLFTLYPRWHGSPEEMLEFGLECYETKRFDTMVPYFLFTAYRQAISEGGLPFKLFLAGNKKLHKRMLDCLTELNNDESPKYHGFLRLDEAFLPTMEAILASNLDQHQLARARFEQLGDNLNQAAMNLMRVNVRPSALRAKSYAMTGEFRADAKMLKLLWGMTPDAHLEQLDRIHEVLDRVLADNVDPISREYFADFQAIIEKEEEFLDGEWTSYDFSNGLWQATDFDQLEVESPSSLVIDNRIGSPDYQLASMVPFEGAKSYRWKVEFLDPDATKKSLVNGVLIASQNGIPMMVGASSARIMLYAPQPTLQGSNVRFRKKSPEFEVQANITSGYLEIFIDGQLVMVSANDQLEPLPVIVIQQPDDVEARGQVRISNLRVRRWTSPPPFHDNELLEPHYRSLIKKEKNNVEHWIRLGIAAHANEDFEAAEEAYHRSIELGVDEGRVAVYLGDICDRRGEFGKANEYYLKAIKYGATAPRLGVIPYFAHTNGSVAAVRYRWNLMTSGDPNADEVLAKIRKEYRSSEWDSGFDWIRTMIFAQDAAMYGNMERAVAMMNRLSSTLVPAEFEAGVLAQKRAYQSGQIYTINTSEPGYRPFYLDTGDLMLFETIEKIRKREEENSRPVRPMSRSLQGR